MSGSRDVSLTIFITSISGIKSFTSSLTGSSTSAYIFISKFFDTKAPSVSAGELVLLCHAASSLIFSTMDRAFCQTLTSLGLNQKSHMQCLRPCNPGHLSSHSVLFTHALFAPGAFWQLSLYDLRSMPWRVAQFLWLHGLLPRPIPPRRGRATITTTMHMSSCSVCKS